MELDVLLLCIGSTEPSSFNEILQALGDDKPEWRDLFRALDEAERKDLIEIDRVNGKIDSVILTEAGAAHVRSLK